MKNIFHRLLIVAALLAAASAFAQDRGPGPGPRASHFGPPPGVINPDGSITLPDGTGLPPPHHPPMINADGSITLPDGTVLGPNADGTITLPNGHTIDPSKTPPADDPAPGPGRGHRGPPLSGA